VGQIILILLIPDVTGVMLAAAKLIYSELLEPYSYNSARYSSDADIPQQTME